MARNGFKVFDADAHVVEPSSVLERYISPNYKDALLSYAIANQSCYKPNALHFGRRLGSHEQAMSRTTAANVGTLVSARYREKPSPDVNTNSRSRIADMDREGVDVN